MSDTKNIVSKDKLLEAGVYFGHKKSTWNPKMKPYIAKTQKGTHILDIDKTKKTLEFAYSIIKGFAEKGATFIFVGTRNQAKKVIKDSALRTNSFYVTERWLGGTFTNTRTIFQRVRRMDHLEKLQSNSYAGYTKKEGLLFDKELAKLQKNLQGIRNMRRRPNIMIIADPSHDLIAVKEAKKLGVKVIGIVDSNNDPSIVDIAIPANDDSTKSVTLITTILADAIAAAKGGDQLFAFKKDSEIVLPEEQRKPRTFDNRRRFSNLRGENKFRSSNRIEKPKAETSKPKPVAKKEEPKKKEATVKKTAPKKTSEKKETIKKTTVKKTTSKKDISTLSVAVLKEKAKKKKIEGYSKMKKDELIKALS